MASVVIAFIIFAGIIFLGFLAELLFKRWRIPDVLFLIIAGMFLGPIFHVVNPADFGFGATIFINFALIYLLFQGSLNLDFKTLFASFRGAMMLSFISFIFTALIIMVMGMVIFRLPTDLGLLLGLTLGGVSSAVVIPMVSLLPLDKKTKSVLTVESAVTDVFCIVGALTVITVILTGEMSGASVVKDVVGSFAIAILFGVIASVAWMFMLAKNKALAGSEMVTVAVVVALFAFVESNIIGASGAIAVLAFGLVLGNAKPLLELFFPKREEQEDTLALRNVISNSSKNFYSEISFFVKVFFFVYLGMIVEFGQPIIFLWALLITLAVYVVRPLSVKLSFWSLHMDDKNRTALEALIPKGLAPAVIIQLAVANEVPGAEQLVPPVLGVIFVSILLTAVLIFLNGRGLFQGFGRPLRRKAR